MGDTSILYRFELVDSGTLIDSFNFVLNPQQANYDGKYRDNIYKTFGGTRVDIWGMDNQVITLSGTLGGNRTRSGWTNGDVPITAVDALKYFRDNIWRYPDDPRYAARWPYMNVKLYDADLNEPYIVHINNFKYSRAAGKPFFWDFNLQVTVLGAATPSPTATGLRQVLNNYKSWLAKGPLHIASMVSTSITKVTDEIRGFVDTAFGFSDATVSTMAGIIDTVTGITNNLLTIPGDIINRMTESALQYRQVAESISTLISGPIGLIDEYPAYLTAQWESLKLGLRSVADAFDMATSRENLRRIYANAYANPAEDANSKAAVGSGTRNPSPAPTSNPMAASASTQASLDGGGQQNEVNTAMMFDHVEELAIGSDMSIDRVAVDFYGDTAMVPVLLELNKLSSSFLSRGQVIRLPVTGQVKTIPGNLVLTRSDDNFGSDILLDEYGNIVASSTGDMQVVMGTENMVHIVSNIISLDMGTYLSDPSFGLGKSELLGKAGTGPFVSLIGLKVREALLKDPRIANITNLSYSIEGDVVRVDGKLVLHNGLTQDVALTL